MNNMNTDNTEKAVDRLSKWVEDQKQFIIEVSTMGTSDGGFKNTLNDFRDDIDKFINTLDFDERYLLKEKFDNELESIFDSVDSKKIPHSDYVCQMFCEVVDDGIKSGINRIRIKSELKKSTNEIHSIEDLLFANNSVEKRNGWFKNIDVDQKKMIIDLIRSECGKFRSSLESHLSELNEQFNRKEVA
jgi:hypothetical protein